MSLAIAGSAALSYSSSSFSASSIAPTLSIQSQSRNNEGLAFQSPAYIVSLTHNLDDNHWSDKVVYSKPANHPVTVAAVNWSAIMSFADGSERSFGDTFLWNFVNNPHMFLRQGLNVDSKTARNVVAEAVIQAI